MIWANKNEFKGISERSGDGSGRNKSILNEFLLSVVKWPCIDVCLIESDSKIDLFGLQRGSPENQQNPAIRYLCRFLSSNRSCCVLFRSTRCIFTATLNIKRSTWTRMAKAAIKCYCRMRTANKFAIEILFGRKGNGQSNSRPRQIVFCFQLGRTNPVEYNKPKIDRCFFISCHAMILFMASLYRLANMWNNLFSQSTTKKKTISAAYKSCKCVYCLWHWSNLINSASNILFASKYFFRFHSLTNRVDTVAYDWNGFNLLHKQLLERYAVSNESIRMA